MKSEQGAVKKTTSSSTTTSPVAAEPSQMQHKRAGSTGTTTGESCESCTTDEDDEEEFCETRRPSEEGDHQEAGLGLRRVAVVVHSRNASDGSSGCSSVLSSSGDDVDWSIVEDKNRAFTRLQNELKEANEELKNRDRELNRLNRIRQDGEEELMDLTANLFQEAHNMVREANEKQAAAEKALKESQMKVEVLTAEVAALKTLVLTSTPSSPNPHLHPQINGSSKDEPGVAIFAKKHRRSPSHYNLKYGRENSPPESPVKEIVHITCEIETKEGLEVDPAFHKEFLLWRQNPETNKDNPFVKRIYEEDIQLCLRFDNRELSEKVTVAVENGTISVEAVSDKTKAMFPKKCALLEVPRLCFYRMNIGETDVWYSISQICRNRIIAVCDFLNYLKYIERGLVKSSVHDVYWEIVRLRKNILLARLGLALSTV